MQASLAQVSVIDYSVLMGKTSHLEPGSFASHINGYLWSLIADEADASGRWLERATGGVRKKDYWKKITDNTQAMTTNDIHVVADLFDISPYEFVRNAREWRDDEQPAFDGPRIGTNVPTVRHDQDELRRVARERAKDRGEDLQ